MQTLLLAHSYDELPLAFDGVAESDKGVTPLGDKFP